MASRLWIVKTLARIPEDVRETVLDDVIFVITRKGVWGTTFDLKIMFPQTLHVVLFDFGEMEEKSEPEIMSTIAFKTRVLWTVVFTVLVELILARIVFRVRG